MAGRGAPSKPRERPLDQYEEWGRYVHSLAGSAVPDTRQRHPGMRRSGPLAGRRGRPSKDEFDEFRVRLRAMSFEELTEFGFCDCGVPLDSHLPLPKPPPLRSWMAERSAQLDVENTTRWDGAPLSRPNVARARRGRGRAISITKRKDLRSSGDLG